MQLDDRAIEQAAEMATGLIEGQGMVFAFDVRSVDAVEQLLVMLLLGCAPHRLSAGIANRVLEGDAGRSLFADVLEQLRTAHPPALMIVEDAHWADDATLDLLRYLGRRIESTHCSLVITYRDDEVGVDHPLRVVVGQLGGLPSTHRVSVPRLSRDALVRLAEGTDIDVDRLDELTGGNAFYATEVIASGGTLSATVQDAVLARLSTLEGPSRRAAEIVSIAPRSMSVDELEQLGRGASIDGAGAVRAGVLIDDGRLRFRHELGRVAVEGSLLESMRRELHLRLLALLESTTPPDWARLAHHAIESGDDALIVEYAPTAAADARSRGAHRQACEFLAAAVGRAVDVPPDTLAGLRHELGVELTIVDRHLDAAAQFELAAEHYRATSDHRRQAESLLELSKCHWRTQKRELGRMTLDEAALALPEEDRLARAEVEYARGYHEMLARMVSPASDAIARSRELVEDPPADLAFGQDLIDACIRMVGPDPDEGLVELARLRREAARDGRVRDEVLTLHMIGSGGGETRRYEVALPALAETVRLGLENDEDFSVNYAQSWQARVGFEQGRWNEATELADDVIDRSVRGEGIAVMTARGALGRVRVRRGDPGGEQVLRQLLEDHDTYEMQHVFSPLCGLAESQWLHGRTEDMRTTLEWVWARALEADSAWARGEVGFWMWKAGAIESAPAGAAEPFALHINGEWRGAAAAWQGLGCPYEAALALADGDGRAMQEALDIFDELGARPAASWLRARMRESGVDYIARGPIEATRSNPAGLTNRQLEVLRLMCEGLNNGEIAAALFVSKKTVEHHVSAVFTKLGVGDRAKAIAAAGTLLDGGP